MSENNKAFGTPSEELSKLDAVKPVERVPAGTYVVGITIGPRTSVAGKYMDNIPRYGELGARWRVYGMAVAIDPSTMHVVRSNYVFGRWSKGEPKVSAFRYVECADCGERVIKPDAVWMAKDAAAKSGVTINDDQLGTEILNRYGKCPKCGGKWTEDKSETIEQTAFAVEVVDKLKGMSKVGEFLEPAFFNVGDLHEVVSLGKKWEWLERGMYNANRAAIPFDPNRSGEVLMFNPGATWLGWVENPDDTGLFFRERHHGSGHCCGPTLIPRDVDGL